MILLDEDDHVLMIHGFDPRSPEVTYWYSLGGGLDDGEEPAAAAVREVWEETGLRLDPAELVGPLREERVVFPFEGREIHQEQLYFAARTRRFDPVPAAFEELEVRSTVTIDWLDPRALHRVGATVYPAFLTELRRCPGRPRGGDQRCHEPELVVERLLVDDVGHEQHQREPAQQLGQVRLAPVHDRHDRGEGGERPPGRSARTAA